MKWLWRMALPFGQRNYLRNTLIYEYCRQSNIHGLQYIAKDNLNLAER